MMCIFWCALCSAARTSLCISLQLYSDHLWAGQWTRWGQKWYTHVQLKNTQALTKHKRWKASDTWLALLFSSHRQIETGPKVKSNIRPSVYTFIATKMGEFMRLISACGSVIWQHDVGRLNCERASEMFMFSWCNLMERLDTFTFKILALNSLCSRKSICFRWDIFHLLFYLVYFSCAILRRNTSETNEKCLSP